MTKQEALTTMPFSDLTVEARKLLVEEVTSAVEYDLDELAYILAKRCNVLPWYAKEALLFAMKRGAQQA